MAQPNKKSKTDEAILTKSTKENGFVGKTVLMQMMHESLNEYTMKEVETIYNVFISSIKKLLRQKKEIRLHNFGTFGVKHYEERNGVNPSTKEKIIIPAADRAHFKASKGILTLEEE